MFDGLLIKNSVTTGVPGTQFAAKLRGLIPFQHGQTQILRLHQNSIQAQKNQARTGHELPS
jgi:hypothetical protein